MGIAIRAFYGVKEITEFVEDDDGYIIEPEYAIRIRAGDYDWKQFGDLVDQSVYTYEHYYCSYRISYGRHMYLRDELCKLLGYEPYTGYDNLGYVPYYSSMLKHVTENGYGDLLTEFCIHSDCDSFISAEYCKKIYADLISFKKTYVNQCQPDTNKYIVQLIQTFEHGSNGFVEYS